VKIIIHAKQDDYILAVRAAKYVQHPDYVWPDDNIACISYGDDYKLTFGVKRNKASITVWGPA